MNTRNFDRSTLELENHLEVVSLQDRDAQSVGYFIETEINRKVNHRLTYLRFRPFNCLDDSIWFLPEIDSLEFCAGDPSNEFMFTKLSASNMTSYLIDYFADMEKVSDELMDPSFPDILFKRIAIEKTIEDEQVTHYHYHLNGGSRVVQRLLELDLLFVSGLVYAAREGVIIISRIDLAADCNYNLMRFVADSVVRGHYNGDGHRLYGYYTLNGVPFTDPVGKHSKAFKNLGDSNFHLETLYVGNLKKASEDILLFSCFSQRRTTLTANFKGINKKS